MKTAVFVERDGLLNDVRVEKGQPVSPLTLDEFKIIEAAVPLMAQLRSAGFLLIVTTNQPGLTRGYQSRRELDRMHDVLRRKISVDEIMVCPHDETDRCPCRKPKAGLLVEAAFKYQIDLDRSFVVSDKWQDAEAARAVGCTSLLVQSPWTGKGHYDMLVPHFAAAVEKICHYHTHGRVYAKAG